jgi:hypothetical protein
VIVRSIYVLLLALLLAALIAGGQEQPQFQPRSSCTRESESLPAASPIPDAPSARSSVQSSQTMCKAAKRPTWGRQS